MLKLITVLVLSVLVAFVSYDYWKLRREHGALVQDYKIVRADAECAHEAAVKLMEMHGMEHKK